MLLQLGLGTSVVECLPLIFIERRFDNDEEKKLCNQSPSIHYYHFISPYHYDSNNKKMTLIR